MSTSKFDAEKASNLDDIEKQFAVKSTARSIYEHPDRSMIHTHWNLLEGCRGSELTMTKLDDEIYEHFKETFPELDVSQKIDEDAMKSKEGKEKWRNFVNQYENKVKDFNFGTLLRVTPKDDYGEHTTIFVGIAAVRMQFYAIEIARHRYDTLDEIQPLLELGSEAPVGMAADGGPTPQQNVELEPTETCMNDNLERLAARQLKRPFLPPPLQLESTRSSSDDLPEDLWSPTSTCSSCSSDTQLPDEDTLVEDDDKETDALLKNKETEPFRLSDESFDSRASTALDFYPEEESESDDGDEMRRNASWASYFAFMRRSHIFVFIIAIISAVVSAAVLPLSSVLLGRIFGEFALFGRGELAARELLLRITRLVEYYAILAGAGWVAYGVFSCSWIWFGELQAENARRTLYKALLDKELEWFDNTEHEITTVASRCHTQIREFQLAASQPLGLVIQCVVTAAACLAIAFYYSWHLTLICLAGMPIASFAVLFFSNKIEQGIEQQSLALGSAAQSISRAVKGIETVKYFNGQKVEFNLYSTAVRAAGLAYNRIAKHAALQNGILRFVTLMVFVQGFWYASTLVSPQTSFVEVAGYMTTFWACLIAGQQVESLLPVVVILEKGKIAASSLRRLSAPDSEYDMVKRMGVVPKKCKGAVKFKDVKFTYPSRRDVASLNGLTMSVKAGETIFIVGKSGSGKSTLANLLLTVWHYNAGGIFIDEYPLEKLDRDWVWDNITYVPQRPAIFHESISHNIRFGNRDSTLTMKDFKRACDDVFLTEVLSGLPNAQKTTLTSGGNNLSGGQRQRVSLARARLRNTPIMILDEPTSGLDEGTKVLVMENLREWRRDKTTIIITHNMSDIRPDDYVYVMDHGRIAQAGCRKDLEAPYKSPFLDLLRESDESYNDDPQLVPTYDDSLLDYYLGDDENKENVENNRRTYLAAADPRRTMRRTLAVPVISNMRKSVNRVTFASNHRATIMPSHVLDRSQSQRRKRPRRTRQSIEEMPPLPESKSKPNSKQGILHILGTIGEHTTVRQKLCLVAGIICCIISSASTPGFSYALARLVETFFTEFRADRAAFWALIIIGIAVADAVTAALQLYCLEYVGQCWIDSVRRKAYRLVNRQARSWFDVDRNQVGRVARDLEQNAEEMRNLLGRFAGFALNALVIFVVGVGWSFTQDVGLTAVGLAAAPTLLVVLRVFTWVSDRYEEKGNTEAEELGLFVQDVLTNLVAVRVLGLKEYFEQKHARMLRRAAGVGRKRAVFTGLTVGLSDTAVSLATALMFWYGSRRIAENDLSLGNAFTVFAMLLFSLSNSAAALRIIPQVSSSTDSARRVLRLLELNDASHEQLGSRKIELDGSLIVRDVSFSYPLRRSSLVLRNINMQINPGEVVAIVGASGAGKSTLVALMERLYAPSNGDVIFSGYQSGDLDIAHLRRQVAIVPQYPYLFPASIKENILYGLDRSDHYNIYTGSTSDTALLQLRQIMEASHAAGLSGWVDSLKDGYDTLLAMGDSSLSGGQVQKIALARALVRKPKILILDECTNGLDPASANTVMDTISSLRGGTAWGGSGTTVVVVTHKPEMMRMADKIVVMDAGRVVDEGGFVELAQGSEVFRRLLRRQEEGNYL
ncbi:hypothetical protein Dda_8614 [Drechslerella dactyloides]|uniref:Uncharacterized protein n=1 Tax=Drechslerella dactyloides TaxID=74499 RepID=A0AAD6NG05_DREDA|nr:hypothetical protein Dda_8614 [Drechslerella dactyloides]